MNLNKLALIGMIVLSIAGCGSSSDSSSSDNDVVPDFTERYKLTDFTPVESSEDLEGIWVGIYNYEIERESLSSKYKSKNNVQVVFNVLTSKSSAEEKLYLTDCGGDTSELPLNEGLFHSKAHKVLSIENNKSMEFEDILGNKWTAIKVSNTPKSLGTVTYSWANSERPDVVEQVLAYCPTNRFTEYSYKDIESYETLQLTSYFELESSLGKFDFARIWLKKSSPSSNDSILFVNYGNASTYQDYDVSTNQSDTILLTDIETQNQKYMAEFMGVNERTGESVVISVDIDF